MSIKRYSVKAEGAKNPIDTQKEGIENQIKSINPKDPNAKGRKLDLEGQKLELEKRKLAEENKEPKKTEKAASDPSKSDDRKLNITPMHLRQMKDNKTAGYIMMRPLDFLQLTTPGIREIDEIRAECKALKEYNEYAETGDNILPPWLDIEIDEKDKRWVYGKIIGHEGRHRAAACINAGVTTMPVFLNGKMGYSSTYKFYEKDAKGQSTSDFRYISSSDFPPVVTGEFSSTKKASCP